MSRQYKLEAYATRVGRGAMQGDAVLPNDFRPELPDWGVFLRWPQDGDSWLHPDDIATARRLIPSRRVFCREQWDGEYFWLRYGEDNIRTKPIMWLHVDQNDLYLGQHVELLARQGMHDPGVFRIADILLDATHHTLEYRIARSDMILETLFYRDDLRPVHVKHHLRVDYYDHPPQKLDSASEGDALDVGDLLNDDS